MKIAIIGSNSYDSLEYNIDEALKFKGYESEIFDIYSSNLLYNGPVSKYVKKIDFLARNYSEKYDSNIFSKLAHQVLVYKPHLVICVYRFIHPVFVDIIRSRGINIIHINPDALTTFEYQQVFASNYNTFFTKDPYIYRFMRDNLKLNVKMYSEAFNLRIHTKPAICKRDCENSVGIDVLTYGTIYPYRGRMLDLISNSGINLSVFGTRPRFFNDNISSSFKGNYIAGEEKSKLLYGAKIVFNNLHYAEIESVNNKFFEINGSGAFQLLDFRPILKDLLPIDPSLVSFKSVDEAIDKIKYYLIHEDERYEISNLIYDHFCKSYSYDQLVDYVLENI